MGTKPQAEFRDTAAIHGCNADLVVWRLLGREFLQTGGRGEESLGIEEAGVPG